MGNIETYPGYATTSGGSKVSYYQPTLTGTPTAWTDLPLATLTPWISIPKPSTAPLANGTRNDCKEYRDNVHGSIPCDWLTTQVSNLHFSQWNPSVDWWNCTLANSTRYCTLLGDAFIMDLEGEDEYIDMPVTAAPNSTYNCYYWYQTEEGSSPHSVDVCIF